jgi:hypothetical protein
MRKLMSLVLQHPGRIVGVAFLVLVGFVLTVAFVAPGGVSFNSVCQSVDTTLTLMLAIDSPTKMFQNRSPLLVGFGWLICLMGWLFLPLLIGVFVDVSMSRAESRSKLRLMFRELGLAAKLDGDNLQKFVEELMEKAAKIVAGKENH